MWDLDAKRSGVPAYQAAGFEALAQLTTAYTLSVASPEEMFAAAAKPAHRPSENQACGRGRRGAPRRGARGGAGATLIVDANEAWREDNLLENIRACAGAGVALIEQPLPAGTDGILNGSNAWFRFARTKARTTARAWPRWRAAMTP